MGLVPYPWSDVDRISPVLLISDVWANVFQDPDLRRLVKKTAKQVGVPAAEEVHGRPVVDDKSFGRLAVEVMLLREGRRQLGAHLKSHRPRRDLRGVLLQGLIRLLDGQIRQNTADGSADRFLPHVDEIASRVSRGEVMLDLARLGAWLEQHPITDEQRPSWALFACGLSIQQPTIGAALLELMLAKDPALEEFLMWDEEGERAAQAKETSGLQRSGAVDAESEGEVDPADDIGGSYARLADRAGRLAQGLRRAADSLEGDGHFRDLTLPDQLRGHADRALEFMQRAQSELAAVDSGLAGELAAADSPRARFELWQRVQTERESASLQEYLRNGRDLLARAKGLYAAREQHRAALQAVFRAASELEAALSEVERSRRVEGGPSLGDLPLKALVEFAERLREEGLTPEEWDALQDRAKEAFGVELTVYIVRGYIKAGRAVASPGVAPDPEGGDRDLSVVRPEGAESAAGGSEPEEEPRGVAEVTEQELEVIGPPVIISEPGPPDHVAKPPENTVPAVGATSPVPESRIEGQEDVCAEAAQGDGPPTPPDALEPLPTSNDEDARNGGATCCEEVLETEPPVEAPLVVETPPLGATNPAVEAALAAIPRLLTEERYSLALQLMLSVEATAGSDEAVLTAVPVTSALIQALAVSSEVRAPLDEAANEIRDAFARLFVDLEAQGTLGPLHPSFAMMTMAATLRPCLLAPETEAIQLLRQLSAASWSAEIERLRQTVFEISRSGMELTPALLRGVADQDGWDRELAGIRQECEAWLTKSRNASVIYAAGRDVWHDWVAPNGDLGSLLQIVVEDRRAEASRLRESIERWKDPSWVDSRVRKTDRRLRGSRADLRDIEARALTTLRERAAEAAEQARRWLEHLALEPRRIGQHQIGRVREWRERVVAGIDLVRSELTSELETELRSDGGGGSVEPWHSAGRTVLLRSLEDIEGMFVPGRERPTQVVPPRVRLRVELLTLDGMELDARWSPTAAGRGDLLEKLLPCIGAPPDWPSALRRHLENDDFAAIQEILQTQEAGYLQFDVDPGFAGAVERRRRASLEAIQHRREDLRTRTQQAFFDGVITADQLRELTARLGDLGALTPSDIRVVRRNLESIDLELRQQRSQAVGNLEGELDATGLEKRSNGDYRRILEVIRSGDVSTAREYLEFVRQGRQIPSQSVETTTADAFAQLLRSMRKHTSEDHLIHRGLEHAVRNRREHYAIDFRGLRTAQIDDACRLIEVWMSARALRPDRGSHHRGDLIGQLKKIASFLNFEVSEIRDPQGWLRVPAVHTWMEMACKPISRRELCPIPLLGSLAQGRYPLLCLWDRPMAADVLSILQDRRETGPVIAFYFGHMDHESRRGLAHRCREGRRSLVVLDELLFAHLLRIPEASERMRELFQVGPNYTVAEPYTITAGDVPREMFYGREAEQERVFGQNGCHLVFGGRQLGKTALLRQVERERHDPARGVIVRWIDLTNQHLLGSRRPVSDLWGVIGGVLHEQGVLPPRVSNPQTLQRGVVDWLKANPSNRIVLLLDEADDFLEAESRGGGNGGGTSPATWENTRLLKGLADDTGRRFKFVFAGLHNVQRTARDPNSPIAHLGEALCIGPFLSDEELRQAFAMVERPFAALGYRFESRDLVMKILTYTNYYPSLIQLFCRNLLEYLGTEAAGYAETECPPFVVERRHIEDAYRRKSLHRAIVDRFNWTLNLDPRYRLIALLTALHYVTSQVDAEGTRALSAFDVRRRALELWPQGFQDDGSLDSVRAVLEEMVGLGVLREISPGSFGLRSPNIVTLLGNETLIRQELDEATRQEPRMQYEASAFRRALKGEEWKKSPLTAQQENEIVLRGEPGRITIVAGSEMSGLKELTVGVTRLAEDVQGTVVRVLRDATGLGSFAEWLTRFLGESTEGQKVLLVEAGCPWNQEWVREASAQLRRRMTAQRQTRVIFVASPGALRDWLDANDACRERGTEVRGVRLVSLKPWSRAFLRRWLDSLRLGHLGALDNVIERTGGWHRLVLRCGASLAVAPHEWRAALEEIRGELETDRTWLDGFEIPSQALPVLRALADLSGEAVPPENLIDLAELPLDLRHVEAVLEWADLLQYAQRCRDGGFRVDPVLAKLLQTWTD